jgi:negative regulator of sigma F NrsF-like protein
MTCRDIAKLLAESAPFPPDAAAHLRTCERCRLLVGSPAPYSGPVSISAGLEHRLIAVVTNDLVAVRPLSSPRVYTTALIALAALVIAAGVAVLGVRGWLTTSISQKLYFVTLLTTGIAACAVTLSRLMFPGALPRVRPWVLGALAIAAVLGGGALYPLLHYDHFGRAVATCFTIGMAHAAVLCTAGVFILRRGLVLSRRAAAGLAGLLGGLTGLFVLFVFCPHLDAGHYLLAHATVVIACAALGPAIVAATAPRH